MEQKVPAVAGMEGEPAEHKVVECVEQCQADG